MRIAPVFSMTVLLVRDAVAPSRMVNLISKYSLYHKRNEL